MADEKFLNITENGSGRIIFSDTSNDINGLYISNLTTCTGIVIIGKNGIALIHDEGYLDITSIEKEFSYIDDVEQWSILYNPNTLKKKGLESRQQEMTLLIDRYKKNYIKGKDSLFYETTTGKISVHRTTKNISEVKTNEEANAINPENITRRKSIRNLNNLYAFDRKSENKEKKHRTVPVDNQFDGKNFIDPPSLICDHQVVSNIVNRTFEDDKLLLREYKGYLVNCYSGSQSSNISHFKPKLTAAMQFEKTEKVYLITKNQELLIPLSKLASEAISEYHDFESCAGYEEMSNQYLDLALKSTDETVRRAAEEFQKSNESDILSDEEKNYLSPSNK